METKQVKRRAKHKQAHFSECIKYKTGRSEPRQGAVRRGAAGASAPGSESLQRSPAGNISYNLRDYGKKLARQALKEIVAQP